MKKVERHLFKTPFQFDWLSKNSLATGFAKGGCRRKADGMTGEGGW